MLEDLNGDCLFMFKNESTPISVSDMSKLAQKSKFSVLKVDDASSSDDDFKEAVSPKKNAKAKKAALPNVQPRGANARKLDDGLVVHAVVKNNNKKKGTKAKVVDSVTGFVVQDADENYSAEKQYREDLKEALRESKEQAAQAVTESTPLHSALHSIDEDLRKAGALQSGAADKLYRAKLTEVLAELEISRSESEKARENVEKYKGRYKKIVELLRDAEVEEKARLVISLRKSQEMEAELSDQLVHARAENEKLRSRINDLENKK